MTSSRARHRDLDRGKADAGRRVHRLEHVGDQRAQLVVDRSTGADLRAGAGSGISMMGRMAMG
jgi:hypothetical protein